MLRKSPGPVLTAAACIALCCTSCSHFRGDGKIIHEAHVIIKSCAANDLGQVMVFAANEANGEMVFVRDFYSENRSRASMANDLNAYLRKVKSLRNKRVTIHYSENFAGNREIEAITE